jgi:hypothetical protein
MSWLLWFACTSDPLIDAWRQSIEVDRVSLALDDCEGELLEVDAPEPYLFVAISRGIPELATLYWCPEEKECGEPAASVFLTDFTEQHLAGNLAEPVLGIGVCTIFWFDLDATRTGSEVSMAFRAGRIDLADLSPEDCEAAGPDAIGVDCLSVYEVEGTQVGD